jgi:hypothetical protein
LWQVITILLANRNLKPDTGVEDSFGFGCTIQDPGSDWRRCRGFLFHASSILDPLKYVNKNLLAILQGVKYHEGMPRRKLPADIKAYFVRMGRQGGKIGGRARAESLSPERRREIAQKAIAARWAKRAD